MSPNRRIPHRGRGSITERIANSSFIDRHGQFRSHTLNQVESFLSVPHGCSQVWLRAWKIADPVSDRQSSSFSRSDGAENMQGTHYAHHSWRPAGYRKDDHCARTCPPARRRSSTRMRKCKRLRSTCVPHERRGRWRPMRRHAFILPPAWRYPRYQECQRSVISAAENHRMCKKPTIKDHVA